MGFKRMLADPDKWISNSRIPREGLQSEGVEAVEAEVLWSCEGLGALFSTGPGAEEGGPALQ